MQVYTNDQQRYYLINSTCNNIAHSYNVWGVFGGFTKKIGIFY